LGVVESGVECGGDKVKSKSKSKSECEVRSAKCTWLRVIAFLIVLALNVSVHAQTASELKQQLEAEQAALDSLKVRMGAEEARLQKTRQLQQSETSSLNQVERNIFQVKGELRTVQRKSRDLSTRLNRTEQNLRRAESRLNDREVGMAERAREIYKVGRRGTLEVLFSATSFGDAARRVRYLSRVADQDRRDFRALQTARKRVSDLYSVQSAQHRQQQTLLQGKLKKEQNLQRLASDKSRVLKKLENSASKRLQAIRDMKKREAESAERVADLIKEIQEAQRRGKRLAELPPFEFLGHQGVLLWPVSGKVVVQFGRHQDPELKTWTFNRGINIVAAEGTAVQAVAPGEVVMVDWFPGYGRFVLLRHPGDYFTLYGHLSEDRVQTGEILAEGTAVGTVGSTGRLDGKAQLHFEIMLGEEPKDPLEWLKR